MSGVRKIWSAAAARGVEQRANTVNVLTPRRM